MALDRVLGKNRNLSALSQSLWQAVKQAPPRLRAPLLFNLALAERAAGEYQSARLFEEEINDRYPNSVGRFLLLHKNY